MQVGFSNAIPRFLWGVACATLAQGCSDSPPIAKGVFAELGKPMPICNAEEAAIFERGKKMALHRFTPEEGLGPQFNVVACAGCHEKPAFGGGAARYRDFLLVGSVSDTGAFSKTGVNGIQDQYTFSAESRVVTAVDTNLMATRKPIPFFGVGLIAEIDESEILQHSDEIDADGDGISGRVNHETVGAELVVGRFGRKAQTSSLEGFVRGPLFNHMGITSKPLTGDERDTLPIPSISALDLIFRRASLSALLIRPMERAWDRFVPKVFAQAIPSAGNTVDSDGVPDPELTPADLFDLAGMTMLLAAPEAEPPTETTRAGEALFTQAQCASCHVPSLKSPRGLIPLFSDLLIHDMGEDLGDGIVMGEATGTEFRTPPLWGVAAVSPYLHDGRADTLDDGIRLHGGEAEQARDRYVAMSEADQAKLIAFLESLGGATQRSEGLLPPAVAVPAVGEFGGPATTLSAANQEAFLEGRAIFDRDFGLVQGLGRPNFNGDSCRACHFDPVIGGSGPADVNVMRQGIVDEAGSFTTPAMGTMAHKQSTIFDSRPLVDEASNIFEHRQTPPVFGLGLAEKIPEATILANADPDDLDGDGISGRARILPDGRLGRLGWKAGVPSLEEFSRDGMTNELGITVPASATLTFGSTTDTDDVADPEVSSGTLEFLTFFMRNLAPPPRTRVDEALEYAGEALFGTVGCAKCHTPSMVAETESPVTVSPYSDFLLHDVAPVEFIGIADGDATMREFRTPPLWGISKTAPYMHDGRSTTIEKAIEAHHGEAETITQNFLGLTQADRDALLAFLNSL